MSQYFPIGVSDQGDAFARDKWSGFLEAVEADIATYSVSDLAMAMLYRLRGIAANPESSEEEAAENYETAVLGILLALVHGLKQEVQKGEDRIERRDF